VATEPSDTEKTALATGTASVALGEGADQAVVATGNNNEICQDYSSQTNIFILPSATNSVPDSNQLSLILAKIDPLIVQDAYRLSLPIDASLWGSSDGRIEDRQVLSELQDLRNSLNFVSHLIRDSRLSQSIRDELSKIISNSDEASYKSIKFNENRVIESYLLIEVRDENGIFFVNGCLIPDDSVKNSSNRFQPLDTNKDNSEKGDFCDFTEIPKILNQLLNQSLELLTGRIFKLTIEIFLPIDYLCFDVDQWIIHDEYGDYPVGTKYHTLIRSSDRLKTRYLHTRFSPWKINWARVNVAGNCNPVCDDFEQLHQFNDCNWKRVTNNLSRKLGLKLNCGLVQEHKKDLFNTILSAATPIAIWVRCDKSHWDLKAEIDDLVTSTHLFGLSEAVRGKRQQADEEDRACEHLGAHLAMLWEDPGRLTPEAAAWLLSPGQ
jgi:vWA-MoxR associated protein C-terminal domain